MKIKKKKKENEINSPTHIMIITIIIIIVMMMICWMRRTGATTWRSFPPLQMIIAIIIVMFYSIFFCCSIWTLIRVCVGHSLHHSTSIIPFPHMVKRFNLTPMWAQWGPVFIHSPASSALWMSENQNLGKWFWGKEGGGFKKSLYQLDFHWIRSFFGSPPSTHPPLQSVVFSALAWYL